MQYATVSLSLRGNASSNSIYGGTQGDFLYGNAGDDRLYGERGDDTIYADVGADTLEGGPGNDWLYGGAGNDTYHFGRSSGADVLSDGDATPGNTDTIPLDPDISPSTVTLDRQGYDLILTIDQSPTQLTVVDYFRDMMVVNGTPAPDYYKVERIIFGDGTVWDNPAMAPRIISGQTNTMSGGPGNDTFVVDDTWDTVSEGVDQGIDTIESRVTCALPANVENLTLTGYLNASATGNSLDNVLIGNSGNNVLNGLIGSDTLIGGAGDDRYLVDDRDTVIEAPDKGIDWVEAAGDYALPDYIENGRFQSNVPLYDTPVLRGNGLDNILIGLKYEPSIIEGGAGADILIGGLSDDTYVVDDVGDTIIEEAGWAGADTVHSAISYTLGARLENLTLTGSSPISGTGNDEQLSRWSHIEWRQRTSFRVLAMTPSPGRG
jgi:Ca2+-binding RTX toxin-like protein